MKIVVLKESIPGEHRVAMHPEIVKKYLDLGFEVFVEKQAGKGSCIEDEEFVNAGAKIFNDITEIKIADLILKVQSAFDKKKNALPELNLSGKHKTLISLLSPFNNEKLLNEYKENNINSIAMEFIPRITKAQSMDVLSSQSNLAGYRAVIDAAAEINKIFPMMMTAAGTVNPIKVLVMGAGVAGLQAIATAKRLGAVVSSFDVRAAAKEQVESLGATFIEVPSEEEGSGSGGYAKEMSAEYKKKQQKIIFEHIKDQDIVITTALIPGKEAPKLITKDMLNVMKTGAVIVDLAAIAGGNCVETKLDKIIEHKGKKIIGYGNFPSRVASTASKLYSYNLFNLVKLLYNKKENKIEFNFDEEIIKSATITYDGKIIHPLLTKERAK